MLWQIEIQILTTPNAVQSCRHRHAETILIATNTGPYLHLERETLVQISEQQYYATEVSASSYEGGRNWRKLWYTERTRQFNNRVVYLWEVKSTPSLHKRCCS